MYYASAVPVSILNASFDLQEVGILQNGVPAVYRSFNTLLAEHCSHIWFRTAKISLIFNKAVHIKRRSHRSVLESDFYPEDVNSHYG